MKKLLILVLVASGAFWYFEEHAQVPPHAGSVVASPRGVQPYNGEIEEAFDNRESDVLVRGYGTVLRTLSDDNRGSRHQRFILELPSGRTLLVIHNIDLAKRIDFLQTGDAVEFYGEYEWNDKGGLIHWTHHDPDGRHVAGWLKHDGTTYQ